MRTLHGARLFSLSAVVWLGLMTTAFSNVAEGQTVQGTEQRGAEGRPPALFDGSAPPPFQLQVSGGEEPFMPKSAWHCPPYLLMDRMYENLPDQVDIPAFFFRDASGTIHMFAMGPFNYAFVGMSFSDLKESCHSVYPSHFDTDPRHYEFREWIRAAYTVDGTHVYAVSSNEFYCQDHLGPTCDYRALIALHSSDGGYTFKDDPAPQRLVATIPYKDLLGTVRGAGKVTGLGNNSDIIRNPNDGYFYMEAIDLSANKSCMMRSQDLNAWLAWNGSSFSVRLNNPEAYDDPPATYHCAGGGRSSLMYLSQYNLFLGLLGLGQDLAIEVSSDLIHWSKPMPLKLPVPLGRTRQGGGWTYPSILDPDSKAMNFDVLNAEDRLYLLIVKEDPIFDHQGKPIPAVHRELVKFPVSFSPAEDERDAAAAVTFTPAAGTYERGPSVALSCTTPSSMIYYTTNGQAPAIDTLYTQAYTGPLAVAQSQKITAMCLSTGYRPGPVRATQYTIAH
jgi:hypothetical protein